MFFSNCPVFDLVCYLFKAPLPIQLLWLVSFHRPEQTPPILFLHQPHCFFCCFFSNCGEWLMVGTLQTWHDNLPEELMTRLKGAVSDDRLCALPLGLNFFSMLSQYFSSTQTCFIIKEKMGDLTFYNVWPLRSAVQSTYSRTEQSSQVENSHWTTTFTNLIIHSLRHIQHTPWTVVTAVLSAFKLALPPSSTCGLWKMSNKTVKLFKLMGDALPVHWFREVLQWESIKIRNSFGLLYWIVEVNNHQTISEEKRRWYGHISIT